ncbi:MAG: homocysteine S-methyltransferase family protein [Dehalococcoidia bacterium]
MADSINSKLASGEVVFLDGAIGSESERRGVGMSFGTWCGTANTTHPEVVTAVHQDYVEAGADIVTANTYCGTSVILQRDGLGDRTEEINTHAVEYARQGRDRAGVERPVWIAGSMSCDVEVFLNRSLSDHESRSAFQEQASLGLGPSLIADRIPLAAKGRLPCLGSCLHANVIPPVGAQQPSPSPSIWPWPRCVRGLQ